MAIPFNATGLWPSANFGDAPKYASGVRGEVSISPADRDVLRGLAERVARLAARPAEAAKRELWYAHNDLKSTQAARARGPRERLERDRHPGFDRVPRRACAPVGDGAPQGAVLGGIDQRRQADGAALRGGLHVYRQRMGSPGGLPRRCRGTVLRVGGQDPGARGRGEDRHARDLDRPRNHATKRSPWQRMCSAASSVSA